VKVVTAAARVFANQSFFVGFLYCSLEDCRFMVELATNLDIGCGAVSLVRRQTPFNKFVRILTHDLTILAGSWLAFVGVDDEIPRLGVLVPVLEVHKQLRKV